MSKKVEKVEKVEGTQNQKITQEVKTSMKNEMSNKLILRIKIRIPDLKVDINSLSQEERIKLLGSLESYLSALRGE